MEAKELKRCSRGELIDMLYAEKKRELELEQRLQEAEDKLADRSIRLEKAGSIAAAAVEINGVLAAAQRAAEDYLLSIRATNAELEDKVKAANAEAERILATARAQAERERAATLAETDELVAKKWRNFSANVHRVLDSHKELQKYLKRDEE